MAIIKSLFQRSITLSALAALIIFMISINTQGQQEQPPPPSAPRTVKLPQPVERTLKNGLRVIVVERGGMPLVSAQLLVKNGGEVDPDALPGVANMTATLLTEGTATRTAPQIAEEIEALGGRLASRAGWDASGASVNVMSERVAPAMRILADVIRNPAFKDEEIERQRQQAIDDLSVRLSQPGTIARAVAARVLFGMTPYGHMLSGTPESLALIKRDDLVRFHQTYYRPDNAVLVIGGDIKPQQAFDLAEKLFGDWQKPSASLPMAKAAQPMAAQKPRVLVIDKPDAGQAAVVLVRSGLKRTDPDFFRGIVTNSVLSGYSGRLNQEIRIKRGLSYGARSSLDVRREAGPFTAETQTKNESGAEVASLIIGEIKRLSSETVADTELMPRKSVIIGGFGRALETNDDLVNQISNLALYGINLSEINSYINNVQAVTAADVQKFAGSRLVADDASIIIVGKASAFLDALRKQFPDVEVIPVADLDLNVANLRRAAATGATKQ
ncbi:MAG TPA: pitrilysin family protein [Pyrinomonadaceae bacterium]|jgi:zinc protease